MIKDINDNKLIFQEKVGENPAITIHNLIFNDNDKKRQLIINQMKEVNYYKLKNEGVEEKKKKGGSHKPSNKNKISKSNLKNKDKTSSMSRNVAGDSQKTRMGFLGVSFKDIR